MKGRRFLNNKAGARAVYCKNNERMRIKIFLMVSFPGCVFFQAFPTILSVVNVLCLSNGYDFF